MNSPRCNPGSQPLNQPPTHRSLLKGLYPGLAAAAIGVALLAGLTGCESSGGGSSNVHGSFYYGVGFYDPWYYGGYYPPDVVVTPPPRGERPVRPEQPIARPPTASPRPTPSIPSTPMPRAMGGRRR